MSIFGACQLAHKADGIGFIRCKGFAGFVGCAGFIGFIRFAGFIGFVGFIGFNKRTSKNNPASFHRIVAVLSQNPLIDLGAYSLLYDPNKGTPIFGKPAPLVLSSSWAERVRGSGPTV